jgi:hypothetical protein
MPYMKRIFVTGLIFLLMIPGLIGQPLEKKQFKATRITNPPVINGLLDEAEWQTGSWGDDFTQNEPYNGRKASQRTEFTVLFDDDNLYVAIKAFDTAPDSIVNRLTRREFLIAFTISAQDFFLG